MLKKFIAIFVFLCVVKSEAQTSGFAAIDSLVNIGRYKVALKSLAKKPNSYIKNYKTGAIYYSIDNYKKAALYYKNALKFKEDYKTKIKLTESYKKLRKYKEAITIYEDIVAKDTDNLLIQYQLGKLYLVTKKANEALEKFYFLIKKDSLNANYSYQLAKGYALKRKNNLKINSYLDCYRKDSTHFNAIFRLAMDFTRLKDSDSASIFIERGLRLNPDHISLNRLKINQFYRKKQYKKALPLLLKIDSLQPNVDYTHSLLGKVYYNLEDYENARKHFVKARNIDMNNFKNYTYLGHIAAKQDRYPLAITNYRMATYIGKKRRDEEYYSMGLLYYKEKKPKKALAMYKKAYAENSRNLEVLFQLAKLSDDYYKDNKIAYKYYKEYVNKFYHKDSVKLNFAENRVKEIKKEFFMKGETID